MHFVNDLNQKIITLICSTFIRKVRIIAFLLNKNLLAMLCNVINIERTKEYQHLKNHETCEPHQLS